MPTTRRRWTRDEDILVLDLYFKNGRSDTLPGNEEVDSLSELIGRTADAVRMRIGNAMACDADNPNKGFSNVAKQTRAVWDEFAQDEPRLRKTADEITKKMRAG